MKIIKHIINITVWTVLGLYLLVILLLRIPSIQRFMGSHVAATIAEKLDTKVEVGRVDLGFLNRIIIDDVQIFDQKNKEMLRAARLSVKIDVIPLSEGKISISSAQVFGAHARLYQASERSKPNFQFVLDSLASKDNDEPTPLNLRINSLIIRHSSVCFDRYDVPQTPGLFDARHLNVSDISAHIILKALTTDSINANVKKLSFKEQSGLNVNKLSMRLEAGSRHSEAQIAELALPHSTLSDTWLTADYHLKNNEIDKTTLRFDGGISQSSINPADLAMFYPLLRNYDVPISLRTAFNGENGRLWLKEMTIDSYHHELTADITGQANYKDTTTVWNADIKALSIPERFIDSLTDDLKLPVMLKRIGSVSMRGRMEGQGLQAISTDSRIDTGIGDMELNFSMDRHQAFNGHLNTKGLNLKRLLDDEKFGQLTTSVDLNGHMGTAIDLTATGHVAQLDYNSYSYQDIDLDATYGPHRVAGRINMNDPNLAIDMDGEVRQNNKMSDVHLTASIRHLSPAMLNLTNQWDDAKFDADIMADFTASNLNDAQGRLRLNNFSMTSPTDSYWLQELLVESGYHDGSHYVTLASDFASAQIKGYFDYATLSKSFTNFIGSKMPTLPGLPQYDPRANNDFAVSAELTRTDWLQKLLGVDVELYKPLTLQGFVNDATRRIFIDCQAPHFLYNNSGYRNGCLSITTPSDSLLYDASITKLADNGNNMDLRILGSADNNNLTTSIIWDNHATETRMSGRINTTANFFRDANEQPTALINVMPSHINVHNTQWNVEPSHINYRQQHLEVSHFTIQHDEQHLTVDGTASADATDSLTIDLKDIDIEYVLQLVDFDAVDFSGLASGRAHIVGMFGDKPQMAAGLTVKQFEFEHGRMGVLLADVNWNNEKKQIDIKAVANDGPDAMTYINGYVTPERDSINLGIRAEGTHIDFMHSFTKSFISQVDGHAKGEVRLIGPLSFINLTGQLVVDGELTVSPLNVTYQMRSDTIRCIPDEIEFRAAPIYDAEGHHGVVNGAIHHQHLTNLSYDLFITADNLLAYDFRDFGESTFYGTVYGTGDVGVHGRSGEVVIDIDVTPQPGSTFVYNVSNPDAISTQEFIEWTTPNLPKEEDTATASQVPPLEELGDIPTDIYINFLINCTPDATLRLLMDSHTNDYITLNGNGVIHASFYNKGTFQMFGTYQVVRGNYGITIQDIIKKNFTFQEGGTITFGGDPYDAALALQAVNTVSGVSLSDLNVGRSFSNTVRVNCLMNISGQAKAPRVDFDLEMPTVNADEQQMIRSIINSQDEMNQQVLYLLGIGRFYPQGANNATAQSESQQSQTSLAMQSLLSGTLSSQINSVLNSVVKADNWNFGANISTGDEGWNNAEYEGLVSGRLLNNRLLIDGQFGYRDNANTAQTSFIGDFDVRYLIFPNGNLALKVYNQTNDRYFTRSSLNTQGIGLIMKKDFNGLRDLFGLKKKKQVTAAPDDNYKD